MVDRDLARPSGRASEAGDAPHRGFSPLEAVVFVVLVGMVTVAALPAFAHSDDAVPAAAFVRSVSRARQPAPADTAQQTSAPQASSQR